MSSRRAAEIGTSAHVEHEKTGPRTAFDSRTGEEERNRRSASLLCGLLTPRPPRDALGREGRLLRLVVDHADARSRAHWRSLRLSWLPHVLACRPDTGPAVGSLRRRHESDSARGHCRGRCCADSRRVRPRFGTRGRRPWCACVCGVIARRWGAWRRTGGGGSAVGRGRGGNEKRTGGFRGVGAPASEPLR